MALRALRLLFPGQRFPRVRHCLATFLSVATLLASLLLSLVSSVGVRAAIFTIANGDTAGLISAVGTAGTNTITLAPGGLYTLTASNNTTDGAGNGLPVIASGTSVTINGNGAKITRSGAAFRFFDITTGGTLTLNGLTLDSGLAAGANGANGTNGGSGGEGDGGAINNSGGTLTITGATFSNNKATGGNGGNGSANAGPAGNGHGGAISSNSTHPTTITNSTFSGNSATGGNGGNGTGATPGGDPGVGLGGVFSGQGTVNITGSTFVGNSATGGNGGNGTPGGNGEKGKGGALYGENGFTLNVTNSTFSANSATGGNGGTGGPTALGADARGGAIDIGGNGSNALNLRFDTIADNTATGGTGHPLSTDNGNGNGGGVDTEAATTTVFGTITAHNTAATAMNCLFSGGKPDTESNNLEFPLDATNPCGFTTNAQTSDPKLDTLQSNGGPTQTRALLTGSGAIDKGGTAANNCPTVDQRGFTRPVGAACDIGAFEFGASGSATGGLQFFSLSAPVRLLDTRGLHAFRNVPTLTAGQTINLPGRFTFDGVTVPAAAVALVGNATVDNSVNPVPAGFATLYPSGGTLPLASNLNFVPGTVRPNEITVGLGPDGSFNLFSSTGGNFVIDVTGYYAPPASGGLFFHPLAQPVRELDTRAGASAFMHPNAPLAAGQTLNLPGSFTFNGVSVPGSALALAGNATVDNSVAPVAAGFATLYPGGQGLPATSTLNFVPGTVAPNAFTVGIGGGGFNLFSSTGGNFVVDITGYYDTNGAGGLNFYPLTQPVRELDTRSGASAFLHPNAALAAGQQLNLPGTFTFSGISVPAGAVALLGNATVDNSVAPVAAGFATLYPSGAALPLASNLNYVPGTVAPNAFIVGIGNDGTYILFASSGGNFVVDITGYFAAGAGTSARPPATKKP